MVDRAQVLAVAEHYWATHATSGVERVRFQAGDLLGSIPPARSDKDIYLLSAVLHGFDDETCISALRNLALACGNSGARIALLEMVLPEAGVDIAGASFDMQMFVAARGRERSLTQWRSLFERSGMALDEVVGLRWSGSILVLSPTNPA